MSDSIKTHSTLQTATPPTSGSVANALTTVAPPVTIDLVWDNSQVKGDYRIEADGILVGVITWVPFRQHWVLVDPHGTTTTRCFDTPQDAQHWFVGRTR